MKMSKDLKELICKYIDEDQYEKVEGILKKMKILIDLNLDENFMQCIDFSLELTNKITALRLQSVDKI